MSSCKLLLAGKRATDDSCNILQVIIQGVLFQVKVNQCITMFFKLFVLFAYHSTDDY